MLENYPQSPLPQALGSFTGNDSFKRQYFFSLHGLILTRRKIGQNIPRHVKVLHEGSMAR